MADIPDNLRSTANQIRLCAASLDDAPPLPQINALLRHCLSFPRYMVCFYSRPERLLLYRDDDPKPDDTQETFLMFDSAKDSPQRICSWIKIHLQL